MVFMGSEKYPKENGFNEFISHHGGTIDGVTDCEHTRFYFDISEKHLFPALDRFVQFFIKPLMKKDVIKSEREAIQREFQWRSSSDKNRKERLLSFIAQTGHPPNKFLRCNSIALNNNIDDDELYEELHNFRNRHYSAHRMTLAIKARLSLDTLEVYVANFFSDIPNYWLHSDDFTDFKDGISFNTDTFKKIYYVKSFSQDISQLHVTWALPAIDSYRSKPYKYISWIIEHKGNGSLTSYLRKKMWGFDVFCGICDKDNGFGYNSMYVLFEIIVELTDEGLKHLRNVLDTIFSFINFVKKTGPQESIYNELYKIGKNNFRFFKHDDVFDLCKSMHFYPSRDYVTGKHIYFEYDPEAIQKCLNFLMPETANIMILTNDFELNIVEPHFKINYIDMVLPKEWIERWKSMEPLSSFHLPSRNKFLTNNFFFIPVSEEASKYPLKIHQDCLSEIWFCPKFHWPVCHINLHIVFPLYPQKPKNAVLLQMYCNVIKYQLLEELHPAVMAGFGYEIDVNEEDIGIIIQISGFNENISSWLMVIANYIANLVPVSMDLFNIIKKQQLKAYYNKIIDTEKFIEDMELWILKYGNCSHVHKYNALYGCSFISFQHFITSFTKNLYIQCLVEGNVTKDFTINIIQEFIKKINCDSLNLTPKILTVPINEIPRCTSHFKLKNINKNVNSIVINYYQVGTATIELSVLIELMIMIMKESLMNYLQTQENLSYVSCDFRDINGILGYSITVYTQADKCTTEYVDQRIEEFLNSFRIVLEQFSEKKLDDVKEGLRTSKQHDDAEILKNRVNRDWSEITKQKYMFDRCEKETLAIENININKLREFFRRHTLNGSSFRKLSVHVVGTPKEVAVSKQIIFLIKLLSLSKYFFLYYIILAFHFFLVILN
ncbi:PREDICTED: nardilysin-like [Trachymyrmex septentrionalis]|uniref:nardilysin-like n=1 Tax=Trachymyrmex septentrionalis TaxID=34720 RepID=UPI00084F5947|nr:PREDICTED: nardilysin-like [Trachymyrmex septentrionalis]